MNTINNILYKHFISKTTFTYVLFGLLISSQPPFIFPCSYEMNYYNFLFFVPSHLFYGYRMLWDRKQVYIEFLMDMHFKWIPFFLNPKIGLEKMSACMYVLVAVCVDPRLAQNNQLD